MAIAPIPNSTALTIMLNNSDIENLVDIGPPSNSVPISGQLANATLPIMFPRGRRLSAASRRTAHATLQKLPRSARRQAYKLGFM